MKDYETTEYDWDTRETPVIGQDEEFSKNTEGTPEYDAPSQVSGKRSPKKKKKRKKKRYFLKILLLIAICVGLYFFLHSSVFTIKTIDVQDSGHFTAAQVQEMAGLKTGTNLFDYSKGKCEDKLKENPYIKSAKVKRSLPNKVVIELSERQEMAVVQQGKKYIIIDNSGIVLKIADKEPKLTLLTGLDVTEGKEGKKIAIKQTTAFKNTMKVLNTMEKSDLYFKKIDVSNVVIKAYVKDKLFCRGTPKNLITSMEEGNLQVVIYDLHKKGTKQGVVNIGDDQYFSFDKKIK